MKARIPFSTSLLANNILPVSLLINILKLLPEDTKFIKCSEDAYMDMCYLYFASDSFVESPTGLFIHDIIPTISNHWVNGEQISRVESLNFGLAMPTIIPTTPVTIATCAHSWIIYHGLQNSYEICSICGVTKN